MLMPVQRPAVGMEVIASLMIAKCLLTVFLPPADWAIITAIKMQTRSLVVGVEVVTGGDWW